MPDNNIPPEIELLVEKRSNKARNEAIGVLSVVTIIIGILTALGIWGRLTTYVDTEIKSNLSQSIMQDLKKDKLTADTLLKNLHDIIENAEVKFGKLKTTDEIVLAVESGIEVYLYDFEKSNWISKTALQVTSGNSDGRVIVAIDFKHPQGNDYTYQESYKVTYARLGIRRRPGL